jgi:peptidoglycan/LPS O-acetylase OafA/YrhL
VGTGFPKKIMLKQESSMPPSLASRTARTPHLDALRIVAAIAVVVLHYAEYTRDNAAARFVFTHVQHFNLFVDLFFVISGFVIARQYLARVESTDAIKRFFWRRIARIYPLHLLTLAFYLAIAIALQLGLARGDNPARYPLSDVPAQLLMLHALIGERLTFNFPSWSLSAEMFCYLAFPLLAASIARWRFSILAVFLLAVAANTLASVATDAGPWTEWINRGGAFRALPSFALGMALFAFCEKLDAAPALRLPFTAVLFAFVLFGGSLPQALMLIAVYLIVLLAARADATGQVTLLSRSGVARWSDLTYSVYMLHVPVATVVLTIGGRYLAPHVADAKLALVPLAVGVLTVASVLSFKYVETPIRHSLYARFDRRNEARLALQTAAAQGGDGR